MLSPGSLTININSFLAVKLFPLEQALQRSYPSIVFVTLRPLNAAGLRVLLHHHPQPIHAGGETLREQVVRLFAVGEGWNWHSAQPSAGLGHSL